MTSQSWAISCLTSLANSTGAGEGFLARSPDGTTYRFDHMVSLIYPTLGGGSIGGAGLAKTTATPKPAPSGPLGSLTNPIPNAAGEGVMARKEVRMLPTVITDRYGNTVSFTYDPARPGNLTKITGNDGRSLTFTYGNSSHPHLITSVTDGARTWSYSYSGTDMNLDTVTLPDSSTWSLSGINNLLWDVQYLSSASCDNPALYQDETRSGTISHPSGASGTFTLKTTTHGRSNVELQCMQDINSGTQWARIPRHFYTFSLASKNLSGPGLPSTNWSYDYGPANASWNTCTSNCPSTKVVTVTDPSYFVTR